MGYLADCKTGSAVGTCGSCKNPAPPQEHRKLRIFKFKELVRATDSFAASNILGKGSHACVYKAVLDDGEVVAVKRPTVGRRTFHDVAAFDNELTVLSSLQCRHLVNLIGYCYDTSEKLLVVEFMGNGTLFDLLHSSTEPLSWGLRVHMAFQAAKAIQALHSASPPIIHRDVKSSNVLVDSNWNAKLGDLGLAIRGQWEDVVRQRAPPAGTMGYIDPQYETPSQLSSKSDVFSFGILLLEILSGRNAIDVRYSPSSIVDWAIPLIKEGNSLAVCDPSLNGTQNAIAVKQLAAIAARSVRSSRDRRPSMDEIVQGLRDIRRKVTSSFRFATGVDPLRSSLSSTSVSRVRSSRVFTERSSSRLSRSSSIVSNDSTFSRDDCTSLALDDSRELFVRRSSRSNRNKMYGDLLARKLSLPATPRLGSKNTEGLFASADARKDLVRGANDSQVFPVSVSSFSSDASIGDILGTTSSWRSLDSPSRKFLENISCRSSDGQSSGSAESPVFGSKKPARTMNRRTYAMPPESIERSLSLGKLIDAEAMPDSRRESFGSSASTTREGDPKSLLARTRAYNSLKESQLSRVSKLEGGNRRIEVRRVEIVDEESECEIAERLSLRSFSLERMSYCRKSTPVFRGRSQEGAVQQMRAKERQQSNSEQNRAKLPIFLAAVEDLQNTGQREGYQDYGSEFR